MKTKLFSLLFLCFTSALVAQEVRDSISNVSIPFVEIYSNQGDLIGRTDNSGKIDKILFQKMLNAKSSTISFVYPSCYTKKILIDSIQINSIIKLSPIIHSLKEIVVSPNIDNHKYLCLTAYFRSLQINDNRPHYYMDGFVEYYIDKKIGKVKTTLLCNHSFENKNIDPLKKTKTVYVDFNLVGIPHLQDIPQYKNLAKKYSLTEINKDSILIIDKKQKKGVGRIFPDQNNAEADLRIYSEENPKTEQMWKILGIDCILSNYNVSAIYDKRDIADCLMENLLYFKNSRSYNIKKKKDKEYQKIDDTFEVFVVDKKFTNIEPKENADYGFHGDVNTGNCNKDIENIYYQDLPNSVTEFIKKNLTERN
jgi:hypothetical protein